jgi:hypothetical protein
MRVSSSRSTVLTSEAISWQVVPMGVVNARRLTNLARDEPQLFFRHSAYVDFDMNPVVNPKFGTHAPRNDV